MIAQRWARRIRKLQAHPRPGRLLLSRALWHSGLSPLLKVPLGDDLHVRFHGSAISAALWVSADARNEDASFLKAVLRAGDSYVDCGANIGHLALVARQAVGSSGLVTAIEPNPRIFGYCTANLASNGFSDVLAINAALGEGHGTVRISDRLADDQNRVGGPDGAEVPLRALDQLLGSERVTLLKIDVEGYELSVLRGARRVLGLTDVMYCELSASNCARFGYAPADVEQLALDAGFVLIDGRQSTWRVVPGHLFELLGHADQPATGYNLIAVKRGFLGELARRVAERGIQLEQA